MGELNIRGNAERECQYDLMTISITFAIRDITTAKAIEKMSMQCEDFLEALEKQGIETSTFRIHEDEVHREERIGHAEIRAQRRISILLPFDMMKSNYFINFIREKGYDADVSVRYSLSNVNMIHKELMEEAILSSKTEAERIAKLVGKTIVGVKSIEIVNNVLRNQPMYSPSAHYMVPANIQIPDFLKQSNSLKPGYSTESQSVDIVWLISED